MRLKESTSFGPKPLVIDRENKVIRGVKVIGEVSKNGKVFPQATRIAAHNLIEGLKVNVNHRGKGQDVAITSRLGKLCSPREEADGTYADLHYLDSNPSTPMLLEAAERMPDAMGFSILGSGSGKAKDDKGRTIVENISGLESADLVADPANTVALNESVIREVEEGESGMQLIARGIAMLLVEGEHDHADGHMRVLKKHTKKAGPDKEGGDGAEEEEGEVEESAKEGEGKGKVKVKNITEKPVSGSPRACAPGDGKGSDQEELRESSRGQQQEAVDSLDRILAQIRG